VKEYDCVYFRVTRVLLENEVAQEMLGFLDRLEHPEFLEALGLLDWHQM
jgi:hypothetical protein